MKKTMRKIVPAVLMLLISAMLVGTSTYAWFAMNNKVTVTGMTVTTKVKENLMIAADTIGSTAVQAEANFKNSLVQEKTGLLEPASTVDGINYYFTSSKNVTATGDALTNAYTLYNPSTPDVFDGEYGLDNGNNTADAVPYIDYVFQIKAINGNEAAQIRLTKLDLTYGGSADAGKAYRVALFAQTISGTIPALTSGDLITILTESGAANFTTGEAVNSTSGTGAVTYCNNTSTALIPVAANTTAYYKVVVRLWLEGEDTTCKNDTYMNLSDSWALDIQFDLVNASSAASAVQNINKVTTASKLALLTTDTVTDNAASNKVVNGVTYYAIDGKTLNAKQLYATVTTLTTSSQVYTIEDDIYVTNVTNQVSITVAP